MDTRIATIRGHLTSTNIRHIKAILQAGRMEGKINRITYFLTYEQPGLWSVKYFQKDRGLMPVPGSKLRLSEYHAQFTATYRQPGWGK